MKFRLYNREDEPLIEGVTQFKYLGRMMEETESDSTATHRNINKEQAVWRSMGKMLIKEEADKRVS